MSSTSSEVGYPYGPAAGTTVSGGGPFFWFLPKARAFPSGSLGTRSNSRDLQPVIFPSHACARSDPPNQAASGRADPQLSPDCRASEGQLRHNQRDRVGRAVERRGARNPRASRTGGASAPLPGVRRPGEDALCSLFRAKRSARTGRLPPDVPLERPLGLDLKPEHQRRYAEVRVARRKQQHRNCLLAVCPTNYTASPYIAPEP